MLAEAGFAAVEVKRVEGDVSNNYYIAREARWAGTEDHGSVDDERAALTPTLPGGMLAGFLGVCSLG
jgi:hypothetical protein